MENYTVEDGEHRFSKAMRELYWYCPKNRTKACWDENREHIWAWKDHEILHRCYTEKGFIQKLEAYIETLKLNFSKAKPTKTVVFIEPDKGGRPAYRRKNVVAEAV